jgi:hypothetical protein
VARRLELRTQLGVVVDAAVEVHREAEPVVDHGLGAALGEVDDREPPVDEAGAALDPQALAVGPARRDRRAHPLERGAIRRPGAPHLAGESAHA